MDIVYFNSSSTKDIYIFSKTYTFTYTHLLINDNFIFLTGYIPVNLSDFQTKKIQELCDGIKVLYDDVIFNVNIENKEIHFIQKKYHDFIKENHINKVIIDEHNLDNYIYFQFIEDYIYNVLNLKINYLHFQTCDQSIIEATCICENTKNDYIKIHNYYSHESLYKKIKKFHDYLVYLKKDGYIFQENKFIKKK